MAPATCDTTARYSDTTSWSVATGPVLVNRPRFLQVGCDELRGTTSQSTSAVATPLAVTSRRGIGTQILEAGQEELRGARDITGEAAQRSGGRGEVPKRRLQVGARFPAVRGEASEIVQYFVNLLHGLIAGRQQGVQIGAALN